MAKNMKKPICIEAVLTAGSTRFGGDPVMTPVPPMLAAYATDSSSIVRRVFLSFSDDLCDCKRAAKYKYKYKFLVCTLLS
jgi:hypothetical protein